MAGCLRFVGCLMVLLGVLLVALPFVAAAIDPAAALLSLPLTSLGVGLLIPGLILAVIGGIGVNSDKQVKALQRMERMHRAGNQWQQMAPPQIQPPPQPGHTPYPKANYGAPQRMSACPSCGWTMQHGPEVSGQVMVCGGCGQSIRLA